MEPLLLVCGGCGVKIRATDPDRARTRNCPRCATSLASAVAAALRIDLDRAIDRFTASTEPINPDSVSAETHRITARFSETTRASKWRARWIAVGAAVLGGSSLIHILLSPAPRPAVPDASANSASNPIQTAVRSNDWPSAALLTPSADGATATDPLVTTDPADAEPSSPPAPVARPDLSATEVLATLATPVRDALGVNPAVTPEVQAVPPAPRPPAVAIARDDGAKPPAEPTSSSPSAPRRLLIRSGKGKAVVAREYGTTPREEMAVVLPDGTIGWPTTQVFTDEPFLPNTIDELEQILLAEEYSTFRVVKTKHYLVFYQCSEKFARDSADLLEELHEKLTGALRKQDLPVTPAEFPLVAVIFRSEDDFRANRKIAAEVQAYYEILSNRIFFFEKGRRDKTAPEVSALRKPQTVVHEGTHQLLHNVGIQHRMSPWPIWLVEGLAEYCSPPKPTKNGTDWAGLGQINVMHLTTIRDLDDPMSSVVRGGPQAPSGRDRGQPLVEYLVTRTDLTPTDYALSWGLTHYLARDRDRFPQFVAYIRNLNRLKPFETRSPDQQLADFREVFGKDLAKLDAQAGKHLAKLKIPDSQALPFYAVLIEQPVSRTAFRRMAMVSQSPSVIRQWIDSASTSSGGQINWQALAHPTRTRAVITADGWIQQGQ